MSTQFNTHSVAETAAPQCSRSQSLVRTAGAVLALACAMPSFGGVAVVVSARSPVPAMTADQVAQVYLGKAVTLPGGIPVVLIDQTEGSPLRDQFYSKVTNKQPVQIKAIWSRLVFSGAAQMPKAVAGDEEVKNALGDSPGTIGYIDKTAVDGSVKVLLTVD